MQQPKIRQRVAFLQKAHGVQNFGRPEAKFGAVAGGGLPAPRTTGTQPHAQADDRLHLQCLGQVQDDGQLVEFFYDQNDLQSELARVQRQFDVFLILVAVAHDQRIKVPDEPQHDEQLGFGAALESQVPCLTGGQDGLHHVPLLIHLDGIHRPVFGMVIVFADGAVEAVVQLIDAALQDIGEAHQYGQIDAARLQLVHQDFQIDLFIRVAGRAHDDMAALIDAEIPGAPLVDVIQINGVLYIPHGVCVLG